MTPEEVLSKVLCVDVSMIDDTVSNTTLPQWDSLAHMNIIMALEAEYEVSFSAADALQMNDVAAIKRKLADYRVQW